MKHSLTFLLFVFAAPLFAQVTGKVSLEHLGIAFTIPDGWMGQQTEAGYILGSNTEAGAILMTGHESTTLEALRQEVAGGIYEGTTQLMPQGALETLSPNSLGGEFSGYLEGHQVRVYAVGLVNPHGKGVSIFALTTPEMYGPRFRELATQIAGSVRFSQAKSTPVVDEWTRTLSNARLTYMDSYYTTGPTVDGFQTGGGSSTKIVIDLCASGQFQRRNQSSVNMDTGGAFGNSSDRGEGAGTWQVVPDVVGNAVLELKFNNGEVYEYKLAYVDGKTLLNGKRYFKTQDAGCY